MFFPMRRWITIWAGAGVLLAGAAYRFAPHTPDHQYVRLVLTVFPWAALWASLVANAALPSSLRRVHHVTVGAILALMVVGCTYHFARAGDSLTPLSLRMFLLVGMGAGLFALFGTGWAVVASMSWQRTRKSGVLADPRLV
jgi:hypothetical protein